MEEIVDNCPYCGLEVSTYKDHFQLIANWIYHSACWDKQVEIVEECEYYHDV